MAHQITATDHVMSVRKMPWHGVGTILPQLATAAEAMEAARLNWTVAKFPVQFQPAPDGPAVEVARQFVTVRTDTMQSLGVVGDWYSPLQNSEAFKFLDAVTQDPNGPKYETAGSLRGGTKVWALAKLPSFIKVTRSDIVEEYLLISNSHDGSSKVEVLWTPIRVVCANTLTAALRGNQKNKGVARFGARHTGDIQQRVEACQDILGVARQNHLAFSEAIKAMRSHEPSADEVDSVFNKLFPPQPDAAVTTRRDNTISTVTRLFRDAPTNNMRGVSGTSWGLYNAITEYADFDRSIRPLGKTETAESERLMTNWFGSSARFKTEALDVVLDAVAANR